MYIYEYTNIYINVHFHTYVYTCIYIYNIYIYIYTYIYYLINRNNDVRESKQRSLRLDVGSGNSPASRPRIAHQRPRRAQPRHVHIRNHSVKPR